MDALKRVIQEFYSFRDKSEKVNKKLYCMNIFILPSV